MAKTGRLNKQETKAPIAGPKSEPEEYYRPEEAAMYLNVAVKTIRNKMSRGEIAFVRLSKRCVRIPLSSLNRLISRGTQPAREDAA